MIKKIAYPRISIAGNPSDGFWGSCISACFLNFKTESTIKSSNKFILKNYKSILKIKNINLLKKIFALFPTKEFNNSLEKHKLALAVIKTFFDFCKLNNIDFDIKPFKLEYKSNIPYSCGFSGSTALSISILRALDEFYKTNIHPRDFEAMALHAETHELERIAGPQDSLTVNNEDFLYMDFSKDSYKSESKNENLLALNEAVIHLDYSKKEAYLKNQPVEDNGKVRYTAIPKIEKIPVKELPFFIITKGDGNDSSKELSNRADSYRKKEEKTINAMKRLTYLSKLAKKAILNYDVYELGKIIDENFEISVSLDKNILPEEDVKLIRIVQNIGANAKFPGSSGAVLGLYPSEEIFQKIKKYFSNKRYNIEKVVLA
ncbi:MAG: hypothetical protein QXW97_02620 [Candidatus Pacearchaeota archaeon]